MFRCWEVIVLSKRKSESVTIFRINKAHRGIGGLEYFFLSSRSLIAHYLVIVILLLIVEKSLANISFQGCSYM